MATRAELHAKTDDTLYANLVGAIQAGKHAALVHAILDYAILGEDLTDVLTGNSSLKVLTQAGGALLNANLTQAFTAAIAQAKQEILGGAGDAYNSLLKLQNIEVTEKATLDNYLLRITALETAVGVYIKADGTVPFTAAQTGVPGTTSAHLATVAQSESAGVTYTAPAVVTVAAVSTAPVPFFTTRANEAGQTAKVLVIEQLYTGILSKGAGTLTKGGVLTIGYNAPDYNNIATVDLTTTSVVNVNIQQILNSMSVPAGTNVYYKVITAQIGTAATKYALFARGFYTALPS